MPRTVLREQNHQVYVNKFSCYFNYIKNLMNLRPHELKVPTIPFDLTAMCKVTDVPEYLKKEVAI